MPNNVESPANIVESASQMPKKKRSATRNTIHPLPYCHSGHCLPFTLLPLGALSTLYLIATRGTVYPLPHCHSGHCLPFTLLPLGAVYPLPYCHSGHCLPFTLLPLGAVYPLPYYHSGHCLPFTSLPLGGGGTDHPLPYCHSRHCQSCRPSSQTVETPQAGQGVSRGGWGCGG